MITERVKSVLLGVLLLAVIALGAGMWLANERAYQAHIDALSVHAKADTTVRAIQGQLLIAEREAEQGKVEITALRKQLAAKSVVTVRVGPTHVTDTTAEKPPVVVGADTLMFAGEHDDSAATVKVLLITTGVQTVGPVVGSWEWDLRYRGLDLTVGMGCHGDTAVAVVNGPSWGPRIDVASARQDPGICNPRPRWQPFAFKAPSLPVAALLVLVGWALHP